MKKKEANPIPRVPPVTRAVIPLRNHLGVLVLELLVISAMVLFGSLFPASVFWSLGSGSCYIFLKPRQVAHFPTFFLIVYYFFFSKKRKKKEKDKTSSIIFVNMIFVILFIKEVHLLSCHVMYHLFDYN